MRQSVLFEPAYLNDPATLTIIETGGGTLLYNRGVLDADAGELAECLAGVPARDDKPAFVTIRGKIYAAAKTAVPSVNAALYQLTSRESAAGDLRGTRTALLAAVLISTVLFFIALREMIRRLLNERDAARDSELKALQAQIHSHFVYNILESLRMMAELHKETEISGAIANLCKLMRYSVNWKDQEVTLRGELDMVRGYVDLINLISDTPVTLEIDQSAGSDGLMIPKMCIQPLVENSVNHGFDPLGENGLIRITVRAQNGSAVVDVYDTGTGLTETELARVKNMLEGNGNADPARSRSGIGLDNVNERLSLKYGGKNTIRVDSVYGEYTRVSFSIPISVTGDTV
jgi:sensor histidine kinase YesM